MRILVVGAGAIGGYFGGRLIEAGRDVTFLVRPRRAAELESGGLVIRSATGDFTAPTPQTVLAENLKQAFDLILLSCKAYDLDGAIASFAPAVGPATTVLPLLNGMRHLDVLDQHFGREHVLGGQCYIAATLDAQRTIVHLNTDHELTFGERAGGDSDRIRAIAQTMQGVKFKPRLSHEIVQEMWEKWVFLASLAGATCLMRASIGDIMAAPGGPDFILGLLSECGAIAQANGHAPRAGLVERYRGALTAAGSPLTASMLRDIERNAAIEADHIIGDLIARGDRTADRTDSPDSSSLLRLAYAHLKAYEARRERS
ncbi:MAG TPA: 2-dehydropantoate 2-reductase [Xanthobacteraceae bacterium]|nr:2-dehydropantoate 2-reductase [Xanthobacteraceae bacterium]